MTTSQQRTGPNGVTTFPTTRTTRSERMLVSLDQGDLAPQQAQYLRALLPPTFEMHEWYNEENRSKVVECLKALVRAILDNQRELISFYAGSVSSVYHRDRADRASAHLPRNPRPVLEILPKEKTDRITNGVPTHYQLRVEKVTNWVAGIPQNRVELVAKLGQEAPPDAFYLATYIEYTRLLPDPILYAKYGDWYVKVAEWK